MTYFQNISCKHVDLIIKLSTFVKVTCKDRDSSHGWEHMKLVADTSIILCESTKLTDYDVKMAIICAWLHDVDDHKYGYENTNVLDRFLNFHFKKDKLKILAIIERVAFSREIKYGKTDWLEVLGADGIRIRDIVSDADKLAAINASRCYLFKKSQNCSLSDREVWIDVIQHCHDKLYHLKDKYLVTDRAKKMAIPLHDIMVADIEKIKKELYI